MKINVGSENFLQNCYKSSFEWIKKEWKDGVLRPFIFWLVWLMVGTIFYAEVDFNRNYYKGFYYSVNVGYSIGWGVLHERNMSSKIFSIFFLFIGALAISRWLAYLISSAIHDKENDSERVELNRNISLNCKFTGFTKKIVVYTSIHWSKLLTVYVWMLFLFLGSVFSCLTIGWSGVDGVYYAISSMSTGGLYGIPADSPDYIFLFTGLFSALGVPVMGSAMGNIAQLMVEAEFQQKVDNLLVLSAAVLRGEQVLSSLHEEEEGSVVHDNEGSPHTVTSIKQNNNSNNNILKRPGFIRTTSGGEDGSGKYRPVHLQSPTAVNSGIEMRLSNYEVSNVCITPTKYTPRAHTNNILLDDQSSSSLDTAMECLKSHKMREKYEFLLHSLISRNLVDSWVISEIMAQFDSNRDVVLNCADKSLSFDNHCLLYSKNDSSGGMVV